jgi:hypothetical protein
MALNLSRNTRVWFTTNVNPDTGVLTDATTGYSSFSSTNTFELQVLDGYSFSQGTSSSPITLSEAGTAPVRGQRSFNTALNPVDLSFSTYVRPAKSSTNVTAIEKVLWNALTGTADIDPTGQVVTAIARASTATAVITITSAAALTGFSVGDSITITGATGTGAADWNSPAVITLINGATITATMAEPPATTAGLSPAGGTLKVYKGQWVETPSYATSSFAGSNKNQLQKFAMIFLVDNIVYVVDNCALNQAVIDFGLDAISMIAWTGFGTEVKTPANITKTLLATTWTSGSNYTKYEVNAGYITNKLSTVSLYKDINGASTAYSVPLTGGSITINNNINYITPTNLNTVNKPVVYYTGTRSITGSLNAYLKTGSGAATGSNAGDAGQLLNDILTTSKTSTETKYRLQLEVGGTGNATKVELEMPGVSLAVPTIDIADVVSTTIAFTAQGSTVGTTTDFDVAAVNDLQVRYFSPTTTAG